MTDSYSSALDAAEAKSLAGTRTVVNVRPVTWLVRTSRMALVLYLVGIHLIAFVAVAKTNLVAVTVRKLGYTPAWTEFDRSYERHVRFLRRLDSTADAGGVVFLGDSQLRSVDQGSVTLRPIGLTIPGDTTRRVMRRMGDYRSVAAARVIVLQVGVNDLLFRSPAEAEESYGELLRALPAGVPVIANAVLPVDERAVKEKLTNIGIRALNAGIERRCAAHGRCTFVDPTLDLIDPTGNLQSRYHEGDGLHLSPSGYRIWMSFLEQALTRYQ